MREVLDTVQRVAGRELTIVESPRRAGDPPALTADAARIRTLLGWQPRYEDLELIVRTAFAWERHLAAQRASR